MTKIILEFSESKKFIKKWLDEVHKEFSIAGSIRLTHPHLGGNPVPKDLSQFGGKFFSQLEKQLKLRVKGDDKN